VEKYLGSTRRAGQGAARVMRFTQDIPASFHR
jgi:hypothetical protein